MGINTLLQLHTLSVAIENAIDEAKNNIDFNMVQDFLEYECVAFHQTSQGLIYFTIAPQYNKQNALD